MPTATLSFTKGLNTDSDKSILDQASYRRAENFTFTSCDGGTTGALENTKSNVRINSISDILVAAGHDIVGYIDIVEDIVYFTTDGTYSHMYLYDEDLDTFTLLYDDSTSWDNTRLDFDKDDPKNRITGVGRYENEDIRKVYWVSGIHETRFMDIERALLGDYATSSVNAFSIVPSVDIGNIELTSESMISGGGLKAGNIQYSYRLFNKNGAETVFRTTTDLIKLTESVAGGTSAFYGSDLDKDVNKSVKVFFSDVDTTFDYVRMYSIFYKELNQTPIISLVAEQEISSTAFEIIDTGSVLEEIPLEEFNAVGGRLFNAQTLAAKNNILFAAGIEETYFDAEIDCRAYRFPSGGATTVESKEVDSSDVITIQTSGSWTRVGGGGGSGTDWSLPNDFDCVNPDNDLYTTDLSIVSKIYQIDGSTIGGTGKYVSYAFTYTSGEDIVQGGKPYVRGGTYEESVLINTTHKRNEVYRYGIVFYDEKGRQSFVNWVGDIVIPYKDFQNPGFGVTEAHFEVNGTDVTANEITINFTVDLAAASTEIKNTIKGFRVVYVERQTQDRGVLMQGFAGRGFFNGDKWQPIGSPKLDDNNLYSTHPTTMFPLYSPDITIGEIKDIPANSKWRSLAWLKNMYRDNVGQQSLYYPASTFWAADTVTLNDNIDVIDSALLELEEKDGSPTILRYQDAITPQKDVEVYNRPTDQESPVHEAYGPTCMMVSLASRAFDYGGTGTDTIYIIGEIYKDVFKSQYNGLAFSNRATNTYMQATGYVSLVSYTASARSWGDSYVSMYEQMTAMWDENWSYTTDAEQVCVMFPVESTINYTFAKVKPSYYMRNALYGPDKMGIMEEQAEGITRWPDVYPDKLTDLYTYNSVYSVPQRGLYPQSFPKPFIFEEQQTNNSLVIASEVKTNGELIDSWTQFKYANFIEVDTAFGGINTLETVDNQLFFWQDKAIGILAVNDRSLIQDATVGQLSLGTGGILERYDYISTEVGNVDKYNVSKSEVALFWVYSPKNKIYMFDKGLKEISTSAGINTYLSAKFPIVTPLSVPDYIDGETLFKLNDEVIAFDWLSGSFTTIYTYNPEWFIKRYNGCVDTSADSTQMWHHHQDVFPRATFYGTTYDSTLNTHCNENYPFTKVFDTLRWDSTSKDSSDINQYEDTFYTFRVTTDYQNTDWTPISIGADTLKRKERSFTTTIPRDKVNDTQDANINIFNAANLYPNLGPSGTSDFKRRIRDKYMNLELKYDNTSNNKFSIPYILINYRNSTR